MINLEKVRAGGIALRNVLLGGNLAALGLGSPRRIVQYATEALFLRRALGGARGLPEANVWEVLGGEQDVSIRLANVATSSWPAASASYVADIVNLCRICALLRPRRVFEIGTYTGYSTLHLALNTDSGARIFTLDLPKDRTAARTSLRTTLMDDAHIDGAVSTSEYLFRDYDQRDRIELLFGDSAMFDFAPWHGTIDLFFIDGAHSYDYVRSDTLNAVRCVRPGGVIAWHDFGRTGLNGVSRWLTEWRRQGHEVFATPGGSLAFAVMPRASS